MLRDKELKTVSGLAAVIVLLALILGGPTAFGLLAATGDPVAIGVGSIGMVALLVGTFGLFGLFVVNPNEARVLTFFGKYVGTVKTDGLHWVNPLYAKRPISLRVRNFESQRLKVNDVEGNPIEIAAVVVWRVQDTAEACFHVDDYARFVHVQSEAAVRNLASRYPYDAHDDQHISLRGHTPTISTELRKEIQERLAPAGVEVVEARLSHLAYAPEIAQAMLQRQQAGAIIAARQRIVDGAVGMVQMALDRLSKEKVIEMDDERKAAMVSNLLVVLCGERATQPVINTGTIYQ